MTILNTFQHIHTYLTCLVMYRLLFLTSLFSLMACAQAPAPLTKYGATDGAGSVGMHTVLKGDTVYSISQRYKVEIQEIITTNNLAAPFRLNVGQRLQVPPPHEYEVRGGDSLYTISRQFNVSQTQLARGNHLEAPYIILPGQILTIPSSRSLPPAAPQGATTHLTSVSQKSLPIPAKETQPASSLPAVLTTGKPSRHGFIRPVSGRIISAFGPKDKGLHNDGINIAADRGTPVQAAADGIVVYAGSGLKGYGNLVLIKHNNRYLSAYGHLEKITVKKGDRLRLGQSIGTVGTSGQVKTPQLHFEIRKGTDAIDPVKLI